MKNQNNENTEVATVEINAVIKIVDITEEFKHKLKANVESITEKMGDDIVLVLQAIKLY